MIGERNHHHNPTVHVPPWTFPDTDPTVMMSPNNANDDFSLFLQTDALTSALQRYLPSNDVVDVDSDCEGSDLLSDGFSCDNFRMFEFKVRKCARGRSHDWTECPYAHPGEKARRRDPRKYRYSGAACPEFRKGFCKKGDGCENAHGVFECWLHPSRYRTQPCKDGVNCTRRVCFFAHTPEQLRVLSPRTPGSGSGTTDSYDGSPRRLNFIPDPVSFSDSDSPPLSPLSKSLGSNSVSEMVASLRQLQINNVKSVPSSWGLQMGYPSPRLSFARPGFCSLPSTPTRTVTRPLSGFSDIWEKEEFEEEPVMERVESGKNLRVKMFEKLSKENPLNRVDPDPNPDLDWVSELVK